MEKKRSLADFRDFRPAGIILFDFEKHSRRTPDEVHVIQEITEDVLTDSLHSLQIKDYLFNHTGDGWMCALLGDDSTRLMDFVNLCFPGLQQRLGPYKQDFRAGIDYGVLHLRSTSISASPSHFDLPGIVSARLEGAAKPNQILCSNTVFEIFNWHYKNMFSSDSREIETKDRRLVAYEVTPYPLPQLRKIVLDFLFTRRKRLEKILLGDKKILIVDDEPIIRSVMPELLKDLNIEAKRIVLAEDGEAALKVFRSGEFMLVLTDVIMPGIDGLELAERILIIDPNVPIVMMTGYPTNGVYSEYYDRGGVFFFQKPLGIGTVLRALSFVSAFGTASTLRSRIRILTDNPKDFLCLLEAIADRISRVLTRADDFNDVGHGLVRHKANQIGNEVVKMLVPGGNILRYLETALAQLRRIEDLSIIIKPKEAGDIKSHLANVVSDYRDSNKNVKLTLRCNLKAAPNLQPVQSVVLLIVSEFIDNALDALNHCGNIGIHISWQRARQRLRISVTDNGQGISQDFIDKLFYSSITNKGKGRGMGLLLVKQASEAFHGSTAYSRNDHTVFTATLRPPERHEANTS